MSPLEKPLKAVAITLCPWVAAAVLLASCSAPVPKRSPPTSRIPTSTSVVHPAPRSSSVPDLQPGVWTTVEPLAGTVRLLLLASKRWKGHDDSHNCGSEWEFFPQQNPLLKQFRRVAMAASRTGHHRVALRLMARAVELTLQLKRCLESELALTALTFAQIGEAKSAHNLIQSHPEVLRYPPEVFAVARVYHVMKRHDRARELLDEVRAREARWFARRRPALPSYHAVRPNQRLALAYGAIEEQDIAEALLTKMPIGYQELGGLYQLAASHTRAGRRELALRTLARAEGLVSTAGVPRNLPRWNYAAMKGPPIKFSIFESELGLWHHLAIGYARLGMAAEVARIGRRPGVTKRFTQVATWVARSQPSGTPPASLGSLWLRQSDFDAASHARDELRTLVGETLVRSGVDEPWYMQEIDPEHLPPERALAGWVHKADVVFGILAQHILADVPVEPKQLARLVHEVERQTPEEWSEMW